MLCYGKGVQGLNTIWLFFFPNSRKIISATRPFSMQDEVMPLENVVQPFLVADKAVN